MDISKSLIWAGIALILTTGILHLILSPHHFEEATYIGVLFLLNAVFSTISAFGIYMRYGWAWALGALIAAGSIISFVISRTVGMPGTHVEEWNAVGIASVVVEAAFLLVFAAALKNR